MFTSLNLIFALSFNLAVARKHTSAMFTVQNDQSGLPPEKMIECAFKLMKTSKVGGKMDPDLGDCAQLPFSEMTTFPLNPEFAYIKKTKLVHNYLQPDVYREEVWHYVYSELKVGDKFQFVFADLDRFVVSFKDNEKTTILLFRAEPLLITLHDGINGTSGAAEKHNYEFSDLQEYTITFEILESYWQIDINDVLAATFEHRHPVKDVKRVQVKVGLKTTYVSKALDPMIIG